MARSVPSQRPEGLLYRGSDKITQVCSITLPDTTGGKTAPVIWCGSTSPLVSHPAKQLLARAAANLVTAMPSGFWTPCVTILLGTPGATCRICPALLPSVWVTNAYSPPSCRPVFTFCKPLPRPLATTCAILGTTPFPCAVKS